MLNYQIRLVCIETNGNCDLWNYLTVFLIDWRDKGDVVHVKDQGQCGSCWAFSAVGSIESAYAIKTGKLVPLSEQQLVDCSGKEGNMGCNGGLMDQAFKYIEDAGGIDSEDSYPYKAVGKTCVFNTSTVVVKVCGFTDIASKDEAALQQAVATIGPMSVAIDASHSSFQLYKSGCMHFSLLLISYCHFTRFV
jgi:cathepsin L